MEFTICGAAVVAFYAVAEAASCANRLYNYLCNILRNAAADSGDPKHHVWAAVHNRAAGAVYGDDVLILLATLILPPARRSSAQNLTRHKL